MTELEALERATEIAGSQAKLGAIAGGVTQPAVSGWIRKKRRLPAEHVLPVEAATGVSRHDLRPDIYPRSYQPRSRRTRDVTQNETAL